MAHVSKFLAFHRHNFILKVRVIVPASHFGVAGALSQSHNALATVVKLIAFYYIYICVDAIRFLEEKIT